MSRLFFYVQDGYLAMADWYEGEQVVCVDNGFIEFADAPELVEGAIYTILHILPAKRGHFGLQVAEVQARQHFKAFDERRFRPLKVTAARGEMT